MKQQAERTVKITQNDFVLFGLIMETFNADERTEMIEIMMDYQNGEIEMSEAFRKISRNHEARWAAFRALNDAAKTGGTP